MKLFSAAKSLFSFNISSNRAVRRFVESCKRRKRPKLARLTTAVHVAAFAPTGAGKGVSVLLPYLLTCRDSMVVVDPKGELFLQAAEQRKRMGHKIVVLDPFGQVRGKDSLDPLDLIGDDGSAVDDCNSLANMLVVRTGQERETHWNDSAEGRIAAGLLASALYGVGNKRSLQWARQLLASEQAIADVARMMCASDDLGGMVSRIGHQLTHARDRELGSLLTTVNRTLKFLDTPAVAAATTGTSFDPRGLTRGKMTVFLVLPPEQIRAQMGLLRMWIGTLLRVVVRDGLSNRKVQFLIDEAASLGHLDTLSDALDQYRGYGVRLLLIYQSLGQLKLCFPNGQDQTVLSNVTQVFFGINDLETAKYVSERLGDATQVIGSGNETWGTSHSPGEKHNYSRGGSTTYQQGGRRLLLPNELMGLDPRYAISFCPGLPPILTWLVRHYEGFVDHRLGFLNCAANSIALFLAAAFLALLLLAELTSNLK